MEKRIVKAVVISKQIHSCFATVSSGDKFLKIVTNSKDVDFIMENGKIITSTKFPGLNGKKISDIYQDDKYIGIYVKSDETFCNVNKVSEYYANTPEFKNLIQSYIDKGFNDGSDVPAQIAFWDREKEKEKKRLKKQGVVLWMGFDEYKEHPEFFKGGFSDDVMNSKELKAYISKGSAYGWIGNSSVRTATHDKQIEEGLRKRGISPSKMYNWISSSDGRHFADSLEGLTKQEQKKAIENYLNNMYNKCIVFGNPTHKGNLKSINEITEYFGQLGVLLPTNEKYNHKKLLAIFLKQKKIF